MRSEEPAWPKTASGPSRPESETHETLSRLSAGKVILLTFLVALLVRIVYVFTFRESPFFQSLLVDAEWHNNWAWGWANGTWDMDGRAFFRAPLYPLWLSLIYRVFGHDLLVVRIIQAVLGAGTAAALAGCGWRIGGRKMALWSGGIAALYGPFIYFDAEFLIPNLLLVLLAWSLFFFLAPPSGRSYLIAALLLGFAVIARPTALVVLPAVLFFLRNRLRMHPRLRRQVLAPVVLVALAPAFVVTAFNAIEENTFVFVASQGGVNFYAGNHSQATGRSVAIPELEHVQNSWADFVAGCYSVPEAALGKRLSSREASNYWSQKAWSWIASEPVDAFRLTLKKAYYALNAYEMPNNRDLYFGRPFPLNLLLWKIPMFAFPWGLVFPLAVMGAIIGFRTRKNRHATEILLGWFVLYALVLIPFFLSARFRLGLVPAMILLAAIALSEWKQMRRMAPLIAGVVALLFANTSFLQARTENPAQEYAKRGVAFMASGRLAEARKDLEAAVEKSPNSAKYPYFLGQVHYMQGNQAQAYRYFKKSLDLGATNERILVTIGRALVEMEQYTDAAVALERAAIYRPNDATIWNDLGRVYESTARLEKAIDAYRRAIEIAPQNVTAHLGLGFMYQRQDSLEMAIEAWRNGTELVPDSYALHYNLALVYAQTGDYEKSRQVVEIAVSINPDAPEAVSLRDWLDKEMSTEKSPEQ